MKEIEITVREVMERTETMTVSDEEYERIKANQIRPYDFTRGADEMSATELKLEDMFEMENYDNNYLDFEIKDGNGNVIDPFSYV